MAAVIAALAVAATAAARGFLYSPSSEITVPTSSTQWSEPLSDQESPARLVIPSIGVDAHVQHVGVAASGNMAVPTNYSDVGWYRGGTVPGELGSAVIDGHVDNGFGLAAVFRRLGELEPGDDVFVRTESKDELHFKVEEVRRYPYDQVPADRLFARSDAARLNLITCEGSWIGSEETYDHRVVVYTRLVR